MKIEDRRKVPSARFADIANGGVFIYRDAAYIKLAVANPNAARLNNGNVTLFLSDTLVEPSPDAKVVLE
jgi:hypothetical protein